MTRKHFNRFNWLSILLVCSYLNFYAQPKRNDEKIKEFVESVSFPIENLPEVSSQWSSESAVIILNHHDRYYSRSVKALDNFFLNRKVIKLNDKASVDEFSELNYPKYVIKNNKEIKTWLWVKIIKPNGEIRVIDVENEKVPVSVDQYRYTRISYNTVYRADEIYKIAIPELEKGDILDYQYYTYEEFKTRGTYEMEPIEHTLSSKYPTVDFKLKLNVENDFFINFATYNGAPKLLDVTPPKERKKEYLLEAKNLDKLSLSKWIYPLVEYPSYKFQITFAQNETYENRVYAFNTEDEGSVKSKVTPDDVLEGYKKYFKFNSIENDIKDFFKDKNLSKEEIAEQGYYYMRFFYLNQYLEPRNAYKNDLAGSKYKDKIWKQYRSGEILNNAYKFLRSYGKFLDYYDIPFKVVLAQPRFDGNLDDLLIRDNLVFILRIDFDQPIYVMPVQNNSFFNWIPANLESTEGYSLEFEKYNAAIKSNKATGIEKIKLPTSYYKNNNSSEKLSINFSDDFKIINLAKLTSFIGQNKVSFINDVLSYYNFMDEDYEKYGAESLYNRFNKKAQIIYSERLNAYKEKIDKEKMDALSKIIEKDYDTEIKDYRFNIKSTGRSSLSDKFEIEETFNTEGNFIKKAGPNYIFEAGKLIGGQVAIDQKEKERTENIYMSYPRSFTNQIIIKIPEGYEVQGVENFNFNVENETGGFTSDAKVDGNHLIINAYKYYKNNYEPNENWNKMIEFLDAAYKFSQEKILFKKK